MRRPGGVALGRRQRWLLALNCRYSRACRNMKGSLAHGRNSGSRASDTHHPDGKTRHGQLTLKSLKF